MLPPFLCSGDKVAILSPASSIVNERIDGAANTLRRLGFEPVVMPHAKGSHGSFSGTTTERLADMVDALTDADVKAILCSRGGYGAVHLLPALDRLPAAMFNKWLIGFSDITALHALWARKGYASLHASMAKAFAGTKVDEGGIVTPIDGLIEEINILKGEHVAINFPPCLKPNVYGNIHGETHAPVIGGNLAVLGGLIGTPFDPLAASARRGEDFILLIEDIAEPIYKVQRILYQLLLSGSLAHMKGLIVGDFTEYKPSRDYLSMQQMIAEFIGEHFNTDSCQFPVAYGAGIGHSEAANYPVVLNSGTTTLRVDLDGTTLTFD